MSAPTISLEALERAVYGQQWEKAGALLITTLRALRAGGTFTGYGIDKDGDRRLYTRASAAAVALLAAPKFSLSHDGFAMLAAEHATLDALLRAGAFGTADHLLALVSDAGATGEAVQFSAGAGLVKALAAHSLRSGFAMRYAETFGKMPAAFLPLWAGMLATMAAAAPDAHARREELAGLHGIFAGLLPPPGALVALAEAYMFLSYCERADKHQAKATIHRLMARALAAAGVRPTPADTLARWRAAADERPTIVVGLEWWTSIHAMFRCYAPHMRELRQHYRLVGAARARDSDAAAREEFDAWIEVADEPNLPALAEAIRKHKPAAILYPSLGMASWWVALASIRLAPVQMMMLGHPAASFSPAIDAIVCEAGSIGRGAEGPERVVEYRGGASRFAKRADDYLPPRPARDPGAPVRVAVPAMLAKLGAPFMAACREVAARAQHPVQWHLFPNLVGLAHRLAERELPEALPGAVVHARAGFAPYMDALAACDLALVPFPFGGTNSTIDAIRLGLPVLTLEGAQPHERFDALLLRRVGGAGLITYTREAYIDTAARLIDYPHAREALGARLLAADLDAAFFGPAPDGPGRSVAEAVRDAIAAGPRGE